MLVAVLAATVFTGVAAGQSVGFTATDEIPDSFSGGDRFEVNTTFKNDGDEPVPVLFQLKASGDSGELPRRAFDLKVKGTSLNDPAPCSFGEIFRRNVCAFNAVPTGEHHANFKIRSAVNLAPGQYNVSLELLSLEGEMYVQDLLLFWGDPVNITRGELTEGIEARDGDKVEADVWPEAGNGTDEAWVEVRQLDRILQNNVEGKRFIRGAQVVVTEDIGQRSGVANFTFSDIRSPENSTETVSQGGAIDTAIVMDSSGSMGYTEGKMEAAKKGAKIYINNTKTGAGDMNAIVDFDSDANVVQSLTPSKPDARAAIDGLEVGGGTDHEEAVLGGIEALEDGNNSKRVMIVLGDGCGGDAEDEAEKARNKSIEIHTIMYGDPGGICEDQFTSMLPANQTCETNVTENEDGDQCWYSSTEDISNVFGEVQASVNEGYIRNATDSALFGGDVGDVDANGTIRFEYDRSRFRRNTVSVYRWNNSLEGETPQGWVELETRNAPGGAVEADVEKFSTFALFGKRARRDNQGADDDSIIEDGGGGISLPDSASEIADNATENVTFSPPEETPETGVNDTEETEEETGQEQPGGDQSQNQQTEQGQDTEETTDNQQETPGPTGFFAAGVSDFVGSLLDMIKNLITF